MPGTANSMVSSFLVTPHRVKKPAIGGPNRRQTRCPAPASSGSGAGSLSQASVNRSIDLQVALTYNRKNVPPPRIASCAIGYLSTVHSISIDIDVFQILNRRWLVGYLAHRSR